MAWTARRRNYCRRVWLLGRSDYGWLIRRPYICWERYWSWYVRGIHYGSIAQGRLRSLQSRGRLHRLMSLYRWWYRRLG